MTRKRSQVFATTWRPERKGKEHLYAELQKFFERNPGMKKATLIDLALTRLFADHDATCRQLFEADLIRYQPKFSDETNIHRCETNDRSPSNIDIPPDNFPLRAR